MRRDADAALNVEALHAAVDACVAAGIMENRVRRPASIMRALTRAMFREIDALRRGTSTPERSELHVRLCRNVMDAMSH